MYMYMISYTWHDADVQVFILERRRRVRCMRPVQSQHDNACIIEKSNYSNNGLHSVYLVIDFIDKS